MAVLGRFADVERFPEGVQEPVIVVLRVEGALFFANADTVREAVRSHAAARDIGQVRDVFERAQEDGSPPRVYPTVEAAVEAVKSGGASPAA